jgi:hypothetical protein
MESPMGVKDTVRALIDRLPDDCKLDEIIEQLRQLEATHLADAGLPPLTQVQKDALDREIDRLEREPDGGVHWREALEKIERGE